MITLARSARTACLVLAGTSIACGGGGGDDPGPGSAGIVGLWDITYSEDGTEDVAYLEIRPDLSMVVHDWYGDSYDQGPNCYVTYEGNRLTPLGDDLYVSGGTDGSDDAEVTLRREGDTLRASYVDEYDEDDDGDVAEVLVERYPAALGLSSVDFDACETDAASADPDLLADGPAAKGRLPRVVVGR